MEMLRRHMWVIDLAGIALGAVVSGQAAASLVVSALPSPHPPPAASRPRPERDRARPAADRRVDRIVERNIFCSTCGDAPAPSSAAQGTRALTLLAVMFAPPPADGGWSVAIIRNDATATAGPYTVGARVGDATIEAIDEVRVTLAVGGGRRELLEDGDVLLEVNGASIATPDAALAAYAKLRTASHVWLAIERNGQRTRMDYDIR